MWQCSRYCQCTDSTSADNRGGGGCGSAGYSRGTSGTVEGGQGPHGGGAKTSAVDDNGNVANGNSNAIIDQDQPMQISNDNSQQIQQQLQKVQQRQLLSGQEMDMICQLTINSVTHFIL